MEAVFYGPVPPDGGRQLFRRKLRTREVVPDLGRDLAGAIDPADGLDRQHRPQTRPVLECTENADVRAGEDPPAHQPAVAVVQRVKARAQQRAQRKGVGGKPIPYLRVGFPPVALEREQVVAASAHDLFGDRRLAGERVQADQAALEVETLEQVREDCQFPTLALGSLLRQDEPVLGRVGAHQVQGRPAALAVERAPDGLAVDRHLPRCHLGRPEDRSHPAKERALECLRVDQHQHATERVVRGDAARQLEEALQPVPLAATVEGNVLEALGLADHGTDRDHQDVEQLVLDPPVAAWVLDLGELADQHLDHGFLLLARREAYRVSAPD